MQPIRRDLTIPQGSTWTAAWQFLSLGQPFIDATWTARAQVRERATSAAVLHEWATGLGTITIDSQGHLTLVVAAATSSAWPWTFGVWDLEVTKGSITYRLLEGAVKVDPEVTR